MYSFVLFIYECCKMAFKSLKFTKYCFVLWASVYSDGSEAGVNAEAEDWNESSSGTEQENAGTELFWLDYQADNGQITSLIVHKVCIEILMHHRLQRSLTINDLCLFYKIQWADYSLYTVLLQSYTVYYI